MLAELAEDDASPGGGDYQDSFPPPLTEILSDLEGFMKFNTDKNICRMIVAGFTGQLRGRWDNYLSVDEREMVINAKAIDEGLDNLGIALVANREDVVYSLILTILEHLNGRFTNQNETVRTLLNSLRCKTLSEFRYYKDTFMSSVMKLPENKFEHWKAKFIDGLPSLFVKRVRKVLRGSYGEIPYTDYTYGMMQIITAHKWYINCTILLNNSFSITNIAMIDSGADVSCIQEALVSTKYFQKTTHMLYPPIILGTPFINDVYPFTSIDSKGFTATYKDKKISYTFVTDPVTRDINALIDMKQKHVDSLQLELFSINIFDTLNSTKVQEKIKLISEQIAIDICNEHPSAFWNRKKHIVTLPYEDNFSEDDIPTKSRPCQMNA
ncbi:uncharacterized protein [Nicotiana tomentosiformis]|uniref:uncharacterized protein n=1 Tax=Nicotiana tomentosiformis TaxID=4098 RepID=UPI00388C3FD1